MQEMVGYFCIASSLVFLQYSLLSHLGDITHQTACMYLLQVHRLEMLPREMKTNILNYFFLVSSIMIDFSTTLNYPKQNPSFFIMVRMK